MSDDVFDRVTREQINEVPRVPLALDKQFLVKLRRGFTMPSIMNITRAQANNIVPVTVTNFSMGQPGQELIVIGDGNTTVEHGTKIMTNTAADKLLLADMAYRFIYSLDKIWIEQE